jgi:hypothetical protein
MQPRYYERENVVDLLQCLAAVEQLRWIYTLGSGMLDHKTKEVNVTQLDAIQLCLSCVGVSGNMNAHTLGSTSRSRVWMLIPI